ncbi:MAG: ABC transporter permease [Chloroflexi bacterium]|nr:ABC transporter permease [Chloroflexota bacterium]
MEASNARVAVVAELGRKGRGRTRTQNFLRFLRTKPLGAAGLVLVSILIFTAIFAPWIAPYDPYELRVDKLFVPPAFSQGGQEFLLGTDNYGRDLFSRIVWGSRISITVSFIAVAIGSVIGALLGLTSGFVGGRFDLLVQRFIDAKQAIPGLILALAIMAALGQSMTNVIIAISIGLIAGQTRIIRSAALSVKENMYIEASRAIGCTGPRILFRHMLPNCLAPYIILVSAELGGAILIEASLSFLGLGTPPPNPSWGAMLSGGAQQFVQRAPWMAIFPGLAISAVVFGFNLLGDALRDVLDPRLRKG